MPTGREDFTSLIRDGPTFLFGVEPTSDGAMRDARVRDAALLAHGPPTRRALQQHIDAITCDVVCQRKLVFGDMHYWGRRIKQSLAKLVIQYWKRRKRSWEMHCVLGAARPWIIRRRRMA